MTVDHFRLRTVQNFRFDGERHTSAAFQTKKNGSHGKRSIIYFHRVLLDYTWFHMDLVGFIGFYRYLETFIEIYRNV